MCFEGFGDAVGLEELKVNDGSEYGGTVAGAATVAGIVV